jgi:large subunit ribosomal protein L21
MIYAIIESGDKQFRVEQDMRLVVPALDVEAGSVIVFDRVLLCSNGSEVHVGTPTVAEAKVHARCLGPVKGRKLVVYKLRARKNSRRKTGHRQSYTQVQITKIDSPLPVEETEAEAEE